MRGDYGSGGARVFLALTLVGVGGPAWAAGDMLKPSEVNYEGESTNPMNESGVFLGAGMSFGQGNSTESGSSGGLALFGHVEPGYQINTGSWSRLELSADLYFGNVSWRYPSSVGGKVTMPVGFGLMPKIGYGYSLGGKMFGLLKAGVGPVVAKFKMKDKGFSAESDGAVSGIAGMIGWEMVLPVGDSFDLTGGLSLTHMQLDVGDLDLSGGGKTSFDRSVNVNIPEVRLGARVRL